METQRLALRPLGRDDAGAVYALASRPEVARFMRFDRQTDPAQARELIDGYTSPPNLAWLITERATGAVVGVFACKRGDDPDGTEASWGLSTFTAPEYWNRGYSSELLAAMLPELRSRGVAVLTAHVVAGNLGSRRVLEKNGFSVSQTLYFPDLPEGLLVYRKEL